MLSKRLTAISEMILKNRVVYDVGCDHGLLPCFLVMNEISPKAYAGDVLEGPLKKAKENIRKYHLDDKITAILADGLSKCPEDVEVVVISGMGFYTIRDILDNCDLSRFKQIIVEPNKDVDLMRQYLSDRHYTINDERVVHDRFYYEIISFNVSWHDEYTEMEIKYGPLNLQKRDSEFLDFLRFKLEKLNKINMKAHKLEYEYAIKELKSMID